MRVDDPWLLPVFHPVQRLAREAFRGVAVACLQEMEIDRISMLIERPVQIGPFAANF